MTTTETRIPEGWTRHDGSPCPVPLDSRPAVMFGSGVINDSGFPLAQWWTKGEDGDWWQHQGDPRNWVIAYSPVAGALEPAENVVSPIPEWLLGRELRLTITEGVGG
jgi:hypothetical protein